MKTVYILIALAVICLIAAAVFVALEVLRFKKSDEEENVSIEKAQEICMKILTHSGLMLFTEAERQYGSGTGSLKLSAVKAQVLAMLPDWVKAIVDMDWLIQQIEDKLTEAKEQWKANENLSMIANSTVSKMEKVNRSK